MIKQFLFVLMFAGLIISCKKHDSIIAPDNILYFDYMPDTSMGTVKYFTPSQVPPSIADCQDIPTPSDSITSIQLDIDQDFIIDFIVEAEHMKVNYGCGSHCLCFYYRVSIFGVNNTSLISSYLKNNLDYVPVSYDSLSMIEINSVWDQGGFLYLDSPGAPFNATFNDCFIGIKINNHYGWINIAPNEKNGIVIKDFAINLTDNNPIKCGQKE